ncbi:MAG: lipopolysaccharide biosynthesis protein [Sphingobacteriia bacterium]|nr:MAG: lipopolysaccharide biosynthesis protein [Sphingobacteriia bacterium]TAG31815.1 MAG: lipopolysaccharide biosynthesis protein [Sphingobacteriia bacterium]TAH07824.1 MAG: lipopolysaccharide biosynthesis protein [Sphingobacteriia bacterium]
MIKKAIEKLKNKHFMSLAGNGVMAVLAMITVAILYRALPVADIGQWVVYQTVYVLLDTFRTGFLQVALIKFYTGTENNRAKEVLGSVWFLAILITLVLAGINLAFAPFVGYFSNSSLLFTIQWFGITFIASLPSSIASWILQADQRFDRLLILRIISQGSFIVGVILLILVDQMHLQTLFIVNLVTNILASAVCLFTGWTAIKTFFYRSKSTVLEIYHFGKYSVGTTISANMLRSVDTFIISYLLGASAVAIYNLPGRLMEIIEIPLRSTLATAMSSLAKAFNRDKKIEVGYILKKYAGTLTLIFIPIALGVFVFADLAISLLGGGKYTATEAANVYRIMMVFAVFYPIDRFIAVTLDIVHQPKANFIKVTLMLLVNIIGDFVGIYVFDNLYGVAIATVLPLCVGIFYGYYILNKFIPFKLIDIFKSGYIQLRSTIRQFNSKRIFS